MQLVLGAQGLVVFFVAAKLLDNATGIGFLAAVVFGGLPALGLMGALLVLFPRSMLAAGTAFWLATGYSLGTSLGAGGATMAAILVIFGGAGFAANFTLAAQGFAVESERKATQPADAPWRSPSKQDLAKNGYDPEDLEDLAKGVARLFDHRILAPATYGRVSSLLPPHGKVARVDPDSEDGCNQLFRDLSDLTDQMLLSPEEEEEATRTLTALTAAGEDRRLKEVRAAEASRTGRRAAPRGRPARLPRARGAAYPAHRPSGRPLPLPGTLAGQFRAGDAEA